jgi:predicted hydrocarbon binding protein
MEKNVFLRKRKHDQFDWKILEGIEEGRGDLGTDMPVLLYRLMQYTMLEELTKAYGLEQANNHFRNAGFRAGFEYAKNALDLKVEFNQFVANLQQSLRDLKVGILRMEAFDPDTGKIVLTVGQDLDCSGLPITEENVCIYDEGFIAGILEAYTGKKYDVKEIDCWASGDRTCRFSGEVVA